MTFEAITVISVVVVLLSRVSATNYPLNVIKRTQGPSQPSCSSFTPFAYAGCFADSGSPRTLLFNMPNVANMTVEKCVAFCKGNNYKYAGLEYYSECYCGASVNGPQANETLCSYPCVGDKSETCGANKFINIYQDTTFPVVDTTTIADYMPMGCYSEGSMGRSLVWKQNQLNANSMTTETCLFACKNGGYSFAGLEFGKECYCGVVLGNGTAPVDSSSCNAPCSGNSSEICGGRSTLNLYVAQDLESTQPCNGGGGLSSSSLSVATSTKSSSSSFFIASTTSSSSRSSSSSRFTETSTNEPVYTSRTTITITKTVTSTPQPTTSSSKKSTSTSSSSISSSSTSTTCSTSSSSTTSTSVYYPPTSTSISPTYSPSPTPTSKPPYSPPPTSTSKPPTYSPPPPPPLSSTPKNSPSLCTSTVVYLPTPTCEYRCGNWCSKPIPAFSDFDSCFAAFSSCIVQLSGCFLQAGFPDSTDCLGFSNWCTQISSYCTNYCPGPRCSVGGCKSKYPPSGPVLQPPTTYTSVYTCPGYVATSTGAGPIVVKPSSTTMVFIPTNSNICQQPSNPYSGYDFDNPVGGIPLPCLTCNNLYDDYNDGNCFKLYIDPDTFNCPSYPREGNNGPSKACRDACDNQYESCINTYAEGCRQKKKRGDDTYGTASQKCLDQWNDCYSINDVVEPDKERCGSYNSGWW